MMIKDYHLTDNLLLVTDSFYLDAYILKDIIHIYVDTVTFTMSYYCISGPQFWFEAAEYTVWEHEEHLILTVKRSGVCKLAAKIGKT